MKILFVQDTDWIKRGPHQQHHVFERLVERGHELRVIDYPLLWREEAGGLWSKRQILKAAPKVVSGAEITVVRPGTIRLPLLDIASLVVTHYREIKRQIKEFKPDLIVGQTILNTHLAKKAAKKNGIPFIMYMVDTLHMLVPYRIGRPLAKRLEMGLLRDADFVIAINNHLKDYSVRMGASPDKISVIGAGVDLDRFSVGLDGSSVRQEFGLTETDKVMFFMGWLYDFSGLKEVGTALGSLPPETPYRLLIVGEGDLFDDLVSIRDSRGLKDKLILTGHQSYERIPELIAAADICMLPAYNNDIMRDIVPIKLYEYLALGKPVIATALPGLIEEFGYNGGISYIDGADGFFDMANRICEDEALYKRLSDEALAFVGTRGWHGIVEQVEAVFRWEVRRDA